MVKLFVRLFKHSLSPQRSLHSSVFIAQLGYQLKIAGIQKGLILGNAGGFRNRPFSKGQFSDISRRFLLMSSAGSLSLRGVGDPDGYLIKCIVHAVSASNPLDKLV